MLEELDFEELEGASIAEKRQAINLAYRRYSWYKDQKYLKKCAVVLLSAIVIASAALIVLPGSGWLIPVVAFTTVIISYLLRSDEAEKIRPLLRQSLDDVRRHAHM